MTSIVEVIQHYQRSIESSENNGPRLLHCINKLYKLPIKVEHLQETGVGKTVNSLRKFDGEIGIAAKTLVTKWKAMVAAEEEPMDTTSQTNESETHNDSNDDDGHTMPPNDEDDENHNHNSKCKQQEHSKHRSGENKDKQKNCSSSNEHKVQSKQLSSSSHHHANSEKISKHSNETLKTSSSSSKNKDSHHKSSSSSSHKSKDRSNRDKQKEQNHDKELSDKKREEKAKSHKEQKTENSHSKHSSSQHKSRSHTKSSSNDIGRKKDEKSSSHSSYSKDKPNHKSSSSPSNSKSSTKDNDSAERKKRHNSDIDSVDFKSPEPKVAKIHKSSKTESLSPQDISEEVGECGSFDSSMGATFDDVLGMLNMPVKKSKKSSKSPSTPVNSSSSTKRDIPSHTSTTSSNGSSSSVANKVNGTRVSFTQNSLSLYSNPSTSQLYMNEPELLAPTAKLEPLDPSIVLELPTISTNYKPMPLNQTVMDCVFNNASTSSKAVRTLSDAEAITHGISSKTMRTKIYSGVRTGQTFQVPSLFDMCTRILQKNIDGLEYTGGVPFDVLKPVLERATPQQLYIFEEYNSYLMEDSDVLWQQHVSRKYRTMKRLENESWREMFIRCQEEEERKLRVLKDSIKESQKIAAAPVRKTQLAFLDTMVKPPRNIQKKQEQYGTKAKLVATPAARVASLSSVTPNAAKTGDERLRVAPTVRDNARIASSSMRPKKAPLMQKTLQFIRGRHKR